jgi:quercetin dioxygenase-like cupin family protein
MNMNTSSVRPVDAPRLASLIASPSRPEHRWLLGETITTLLSGASTGGELTVMEVRTPPGGGVPFLHTHPGGETFVVLDGTYEIYGQIDGEKQAIDAPVGRAVFIPSDAPHGYANVGDTPGRMLMLLHAGSRMEDFFRAVGTRIDDPAHPPAMEGPPDMERLAAVMAEYDMHFIEQPQL